jgi:hypothetical protein
LDSTQDTYFKRFEYGPADVDRALKSNLTTLSFAPVTLTQSRGSALKVCFCDSVLHPTCSTPADFDVELGRLQISGTTCQAVRPLAATHDCRQQEFSGLACTPKPPVLESGRSIAVVPPATKTVTMSSTFILSEKDMWLLRSFPAALSFGILNGLANGLGVSATAVEILATDHGGSPGDFDSVTVDFKVTGNFEVASTVEAFRNGSPSLEARVASAIEAALAVQSLDGLRIVSVNSSSYVAGASSSALGNSTNTSRI